MKKRLFILFPIILVALLAACAAPAPAPAPSPAPAPAPSPAPAPAPSPAPAPAPSPAPAPAPLESVTFKWASYPAPGDIRTEQMEVAIQWLKERSNGRIKVNFFPSSQLYADNQMLGAVRDGLTDIGSVNTSTFSGLEPIFSLGTTPAGVNFDNWVPMMLDDGLNEKVFEPAFNRQNQHILYGSPTGTQALFFKTPVRVLEDMKGMKLRSTGAGTDRYFELLGAVPVRIASSEVYIAAQRGTIDGCTHSITSYIGFKEYEPLPYFVEPHFGMGFMHFTMNLDVYNGLPDDLRQIVDSVFLDVWKDWPVRAGKWQQESIDWVQTQPGVDYYELPPDEMARWNAALAPYWDEWVKDKGPDGQTVLAVLQKYWK